MRPRSPYETRSCSSTCDGRFEPRRPATNFTSGAYVRMRRSRSARSRVARYSCQSACVSPPGAVPVMRRTGPLDGSRPSWPRRENTTSVGRSSWPVVQFVLSARPGSPGQIAHPERQRGRRDRDYPCPAALERRPGRHERQGDRDRREEQREPDPLHGRTLLPGRRVPLGRPATLVTQPRGVAQLVAHRSPKPGVAGSSPVAPATTKPPSLRGFRVSQVGCRGRLATRRAPQLAIHSRRRCAAPPTRPRI